MAIDLALSTGGERQSRTRRAEAQPVDTGEVTTRSRDFARTVSVVRPASVDMTGLTNSLTSFFGGLIQNEQERELERQDNENKDEIARLEAEVRQDREGARLAIRTGDYTKFIPKDSLRRRRVIQQNFQRLVAQRMAADDFEGDLRAKIRATPMDGDPEDAIGAFLKDNLKGADPAFAQTYTRVISQLSKKEVSEFTEGRLELQQAKAERLSIETIQRDVGGGLVPPTVDGLIAMRSKITGALPMNAPEAVGRGDAIMDQTLISMAAGGNALALKLAEMPDPMRDGTSVLSRNPGKLEKAAQAFIKRKNDVATVQADNELEDFEERLAVIRLGQPREGDSLASLWADHIAHKQRHGDSNKADTIRDKIVEEMNKKGITAGSYKRIAKGLLPGVSDADWSKVAKSLWDGTAIPALMAEGLSEEAARNRAWQALGRRGSGKEARDANGAVLLGSTNAQEVSETFVKLMAVDRISDRPMKNFHLPENATDLYSTMLWAQKSGRDPMQVRAQFLEALDASNGEGGPRSHFEQRLVSPGAGRGMDKGKTQGRGGVSEQAAKLWSEIDRQDLETAGLINRATGGLLGGTTLPAYDELPPVAQDRLESAINTASFMLSRSHVSVDEVRALAGEMVRGEFGLELSPEGKPSITLDQTPPLSLAPDGTPAPGDRVTMAVLERAKASLETPEAAAVVTAIGGHGGLTQDTLTRAGGGLAVRSMATGFPQDINLMPGSKMIIPISDIPPNMPAAFFEVVQKDEAKDTMLIRIPNAPEPGANNRVYLNDNLFMLYDDSRKGWTLRYADTGAPKMSMSELNEKNKAARRAGPVSQRDLTEVPMGDLKRLAGKGNLDATSEIARRGVVGSPVPQPDSEGPLNDDEMDGQRDQRDGAMNELQSRGVISPQTAVDDDPEADLDTRTRAGLLRERSNGRWLDDLTAPRNKRFLTEVSTILEEHEGRVPYVYDDATARAWGPKAKGDPTVGIGFNMTRPDARALIKKVGADYDKLMAGKTVLGQAQQDKLLALAVRESANWLRNHFEGVEMSNHRWMSLISLTYNSRWDESGPTLIGPKLTAAIREGRWDDAADEIEHNSNKSGRLGLTTRRKHESNLFRGTFNQGAV
jgi:GH24 family phage-related lysozyme (muramidase)